MHLLVALVKRVTCWNIINKEKQADPKFLTGKDDQMAGTKMLMKLSKIMLNNAMRIHF